MMYYLGWIGKQFDSNRFPMT